MRLLERNPSPTDMLQSALDGLAMSLWCALPGIIESYDPTKGTCSVLPSIQGRISNPDGTHRYEKMPLLQDCPVVYMGGGGFVATFPIQAGDECLVIFADRCIDGWWQNGGAQVPPDPRIHDLSDGFAIVGPRSQPSAIPNVSPSTAQLRSLDGSTYVEIASGGVVNIVAPGGLNITGPVTINGNLAVTGTTTGTGNISTQGTVTASGEGTFNGIEVSSHRHTGVQSGASNTGAPIA